MNVLEVVCVNYSCVFKFEFKLHTTCGPLKQTYAVVAWLIFGFFVPTKASAIYNGWITAPPPQKHSILLPVSELIIMTAQQANLTDRSKLRMERLRLEELEQQRWEQEALVMPEVRSYEFSSAVYSAYYPQRRSTKLS